MSVSSIEPNRFARPMTSCLDALEKILSPARSLLVTTAPGEGVSVREARGFAPGEIAAWDGIVAGVAAGKPPASSPGIADQKLLRDPIVLSLPLEGGRRSVLALFGAKGTVRLRGGARTLAAAFVEEVGRAWVLEKSLVSTLVSFQMTAEKKDRFYQGHSDRVSRWAHRTGRAMGLPEEERYQIQLAGFLHDIGKVGIVDAVLNKEGALTDEEFQIVALHPVIGENLIRPVPHLKDVALAVRHHHERWDGTGYPDGLPGDAIPLAARILGVCEAYDAMVHDAPFHRTLNHAGACAQLRSGAGNQFDPAVVEAFVSLKP